MNANLSNRGSVTKGAYSDYTSQGGIFASKMSCEITCHVKHRSQSKGNLHMARMARIQLEIPEEKLRELEALMEKCGIKTKKELINNALTLLDWAVNEKRTGRIIASFDQEKDTVREIVMPILSSSAAAA